MEDRIFELEDRLAQFETMYGQRWRAPAVLRLSPMRTKMLGAIVAQPGQCTQKNLHTILYNGRYDDAPDLNCVQVQMVNLRKALRPFGVKIGSKWGFGYFITPDNIAKLNALYAPGEQP